MQKIGITECVLDRGDHCAGLLIKHLHCGSPLCSFYKTARQEYESQAYCRERARRLGFTFKTTAELTEVYENYRREV